MNYFIQINSNYFSINKSFNILVFELWLSFSSRLGDSSYFSKVINSYITQPADLFLLKLTLITFSNKIKRLKIFSKY